LAQLLVNLLTIYTFCVFGRILLSWFPISPGSPVATAVETLERRATDAEAKLAELQSRPADTSDTEDSLRRTLVLAQRTADLAIQEAKEEAARVLADATERRDAAERELAELRQRLHDEVEEETRGHRERLHGERAALQADVEALEAHLARERERLRIYFSDQLRRVEEGEPGMAGAPEMQAHVEAPATATAGPFDEGAADDDETPAVTDGADPEATGEPSEEEDPFLAELRRAVNDDQPLGPREDVSAGDQADDDDGFDLFARGDDEAGRFGSRLRRRR
jgi:cell division septum initiation protein DivIVA